MDMKQTLFLIEKIANNKKKKTVCTKFVVFSNKLGKIVKKIKEVPDNEHVAIPICIRLEWFSHMIICVFNRLENKLYYFDCDEDACIYPKLLEYLCLLTKIDQKNVIYVTSKNRITKFDCTYQCIRFLNVFNN